MKKFALIIAVASVLAAFSSAQFMAMGGSTAAPYQYLSRKDVKDDLKITDDQNTKILAARQDLNDAMRQAFQDAQANGGGGDVQAAFAAMQKTMKPLMDKYNDAVKAALTNSQQTRILQIYIQIQGNSSLTDPDVQKLVGLKDDQIAHITDLQKGMSDAMTVLFQKVQSQEIDRDTMRDDMQKNQDALKTALGKVLTDDQKTKFKTAEGPKFTLDTTVPLNQFGGGRASGGGN